MPWGSSLECFVSFGGQAVTVWKSIDIRQIRKIAPSGVVGPPARGGPVTVVAARAVVPYAEACVVERTEITGFRPRDQNDREKLRLFERQCCRVLVVALVRIGEVSRLRMANTCCAYL